MEHKKRKVVDDGVFLGALPCSKQYEKSYMHRDTVLHVLASKKGFVITTSADGMVKFWARTEDGSLEVAKAFRSHEGPIGSAVLSSDGGARLATASPTEEHIKIFDVATFDMVSMIKVPEGFKPGCLCWLGSALLVGEAEGNRLIRWDALDKSGKRGQLEGVEDIAALAYDRIGQRLIVASADGILSYHSEDYKNILLEDSHLEDAKGSKIFSISLSESGKHFALIASDRGVRVYRTATGRLHRKYDESLAAYEGMLARGAIKMDEVAFGQRMALEREIDRVGTAPFDAVFDESGSFLIYTSPVGVKVLSLASNRVALTLGGTEPVRFTALTLLQHDTKDNIKSSFELVASDQTSAQAPFHPMLICAAWKQLRFYVFTRNEPGKIAERDILNERIAKGDVKQAEVKALPTQAILRSTMGDIVFQLLPDVAPLAVENFATHAQNGYYDSLIFHRIIKGFMIQTGDPLGDGTGGESIWGHDFRDEIHPEVKHDQPFTLSMANAGPGTNGSQFFITTVKCPWLDGKHTIFGRAIRGSDVVQAIEAVETDELDKPTKDVKILQIDIV